MENQEFYLGSRKYNLNNFRTNIEGNWREDVQKYPAARYWFSVENIDCLIKRADDFQYYGTIILKIKDRDYSTKLNLLQELWPLLINFLHYNGYKGREYDFYYVLSFYSGDCRYITFGFRDQTKDHHRKYYYSFDQAKELLTGIAKFFANRNNFSMDFGAPFIITNGLRYNKL